MGRGLAALMFLGSGPLYIAPDRLDAVPKIGIPTATGNIRSATLVNTLISSRQLTVPTLRLRMLPDTVA